MTPKPNGDDPEAAARREQRSKEARVKALLCLEDAARLLRPHLKVEERSEWIAMFAKWLAMDDEETR